nr:IseA DL-endopeptidase inhibitor family protein [Paenibacillus oenotherae]
MARFINRAEISWFKVFDSSRGRKIIIVRGDEYAQLPLRFSTRAKVFAYFRRFWSVKFSRRLLCNLKTIVYRGRLYVIVGDPGPVPVKVVSLRILCRTSTRIRVRAVLTGGLPERQVIFYTIKLSSSRGLTIIRRSNLRFDYRYLPCK